ncbi:hypothetical protein ACA910_005108 [Epithemia clementina (nom. ined.)]
MTSSDTSNNNVSRRKKVKKKRKSKTETTGSDQLTSSIGDTAAQVNELSFSEDRRVSTEPQPSLNKKVRKVKGAKKGSESAKAKAQDDESDVADELSKANLDSSQATKKKKKQRKTKQGSFIGLEGEPSLKALKDDGDAQLPSETKGRSEEIHGSTTNVVKTTKKRKRKTQRVGGEVDALDSVTMPPASNEKHPNTVTVKSSGSSINIKESVHEANMQENDEKSNETGESSSVRAASALGPSSSTTLSRRHVLKPGEKAENVTVKSEIRESLLPGAMNQTTSSIVEDETALLTDKHFEHVNPTNDSREKEANTVKPSDSDLDEVKLNATNSMFRSFQKAEINMVDAEAVHMNGTSLAVRSSNNSIGGTDDTAQKPMMNESSPLQSTNPDTKVSETRKENASVNLTRTEERGIGARTAQNASRAKHASTTAIVGGSVEGNPSHGGEKETDEVDQNEECPNGIDPPTVISIKGKDGGQKDNATHLSSDMLIPQTSNSSDPVHTLKNATASPVPGWVQKDINSSESARKKRSQIAAGSQTEKLKKAFVPQKFNRNVLVSCEDEDTDMFISVVTWNLGKNHLLKTMRSSFVDSASMVWTRKAVTLF